MWLVLEHLLLPQPFFSCPQHERSGLFQTTIPFFIMIPESCYLISDFLLETSYRKGRLGTTPTDTNHPVTVVHLPPPTRQLLLPVNKHKVSTAVCTFKNTKNTHKTHRHPRVLGTG